MNLANHLAQWRDRSPDQWFALANRFLPPIAVTVLVLLIAFEAADLTWRLLDAPQTEANALSPFAVASAATDAGNYDSLAGWEPFGKAPKDVSNTISANVLLDAPDTDLNLTLMGTWVAQELPERDSEVVPERGSAIIATGRSEQRAYWSGEEIEGVGDTTLFMVFGKPDERVIIRRSDGRLETLRYEDTDDSGSSPASRIASRTPQRRPGPGSTTAISVVDAANELGALFGQHVQFALAAQEGQIIGFRVNPKGDGEVFSQLGLEPGDVLTEVNGRRLNGLQDVAQVLEALGQAEQANVRLRRGDVDQAKVIDVGQIQRLAESLQ
jgi:general secretion pathway protein C